MRHVAGLAKTSCVLAFFFFLVAACTEDKSSGSITLTSSAAIELYPVINQTGTVSFHASSDWKATCTADWLIFTPRQGGAGDNTITLTTISNNRTLNINGTIRIQPVRNNTLQEGDSIRIFNATRFTGNPTVEGIDGIEWDATRIAEGLLFVKHIDTAVSPVTLHSSPVTKGVIYDLRGRLVRQSTNTEGLKPGIYLIDGRKIVIK